VTCSPIGGLCWRWLRRATRSSDPRAALAVALAAGLLAAGPLPTLAADQVLTESARAAPAADPNAAPSTRSAQALAAALEFWTQPMRAEAAPPAPALGDAIAGFALAFQGYPYVAAGNTPAGFDCSGFTQYVVLNTVGVDVGHAVEGQPWAGAWVEWGAWRPGDLVFFQNTYRAGISHAGIYVGDGLFVHAQNEGTGVVVTSMFSDYYAARYYGAVRVW
jgi:cell wall-associated NlpC family hydrolase